MMFRACPVRDRGQDAVEDAEVHPGRQHVNVIRVHGRMAVDLADRHPGRAGQNLGEGALFGQALMLDEDKDRPA